MGARGATTDPAPAVDSLAEAHAALTQRAIFVAAREDARASLSDAVQECAAQLALLAPRDRGGADGAGSATEGDPRTRLDALREEALDAIEQAPSAERVVEVLEAFRGALEELRVQAQAERTTAVEQADAQEIERLRGHIASLE